MRTKIIIAAGLMLALVLSCADLGRDNPLDPGSSKYDPSLLAGTSSDARSSSSNSESSSSILLPSSSSVATASSSSVAKSSSSSVAVDLDLCAGFEEGTTREHYGKNKAQFCDERDGNKYVYVTIGSSSSAQIWMAENLNYNTNTDGSKCYDNDSNRCATYGRLYDWATAMALFPSCNSSSCTMQINNKHQGICPRGWHIPSDVDWNALMKSINPSCSDNNDCDGIGRLLKAKNGWADNGNGTDDFSFSALPSGYFYNNSSDVGNIGYWWSTSEYNNISAYRRGISNSYAHVSRNFNDKSYYLSVRCVKD